MGFVDCICSNRQKMDFSAMQFIISVALHVCPLICATKEKQTMMLTVLYQTNCKLQIAQVYDPPWVGGGRRGLVGSKTLFAVLSPMSLARSAAGVASWFCCDAGCLLYRFVPMPPWKSLTWRLRSLDWTTLSSSTSPDLIATNLCGKLVLPLNAFYYVHVHGLISLLCRTYTEIQDKVFWCLLLEK